ncbi:hypothetical protein EVAR_88070_1 [Eumeta japonica]|uniref:Uncharacterized protein n=1 Tax=Eumeta variegata TaxID=151549 RepID=A0A4C1WJE7_EUMVA|nr:hypothetical protein EVAR_88070_1 [Eumeta japonica]
MNYRTERDHSTDSRRLVILPSVQRWLLNYRLRIGRAVLGYVGYLGGQRKGPWTHSALVFESFSSDRMSTAIGRSAPPSLFADDRRTRETSAILTDYVNRYWYDVTVTYVLKPSNRIIRNALTYLIYCFSKVLAIGCFQLANGKSTMIVNILA